jgi:hypothetical protein
MDPTLGKKILSALLCGPLVALTNTTEDAEAATEFNPDKTWTAVPD